MVLLLLMVSLLCLLKGDLALPPQTPSPELPTVTTSQRGEEEVNVAKTQPSLCGKQDSSIAGLNRIRDS